MNRMTSSQPSSSCKIFVGGLAWGTTSESLRAHFEKYGTVIDATVMRDLETLKSRGFGFVLFANKQQTETALSMKDIRIDGRKVEVKRSLSREDAPPPISCMNKGGGTRDGDTNSARLRGGDSQKNPQLPDASRTNDTRQTKNRKNKYPSDASVESRRSDQHGPKGSIEPPKRHVDTSNSGSVAIPPPAGSRSEKDGMSHSSPHDRAPEASQSSEQRNTSRSSGVHGETSRVQESQRERGDSVYSSGPSKRETSGPSPPSIAARKIFIGGLHYGTGEDILRQYFSEFGTVQFAQVLYNRETSRSRGFGFVIFSEDSEGGGESAVDRVFAKGAFHKVDGKEVEIKRAIPKDKDREADNVATPASSSQSKESPNTAAQPLQPSQASDSAVSVSKDTRKQSLSGEKSNFPTHNAPAPTAPPQDPWSGPNKGSLAMRLKMSMMEPESATKPPLSSATTTHSQQNKNANAKAGGISEISPHVAAKNTPPGPLGLHSPLMSGEELKSVALTNDASLSELLLDRPSNASVVSIARTFASSSYTCGEQASIDEFNSFSDEESDAASGWAAAKFAATDLINDVDEVEGGISNSLSISAPISKHKDEGSHIFSALSNFSTSAVNTNAPFAPNRVRTISGTSDMMLSSSRMDWNPDHPSNLTIQRARGITNDSTASSLFSFQFGGSSPLATLSTTSNSPANPYLSHHADRSGYSDSADTSSHFSNTGMNANFSHQVFPNQLFDNRSSPSLFGASNQPRPFSRMSSEQNFWKPSGANEFHPSHDAMMMQQAHQSTTNTMSHARMSGNMPQPNMPYMNHFPSPSIGVAPLDYFVSSLEKSTSAHQPEPNPWDQSPASNNLGVGIRMQPISEMVRPAEPEVGNDNRGNSRTETDSAEQLNAGYLHQGTLRNLRNPVNFQ